MESYERIQEEEAGFQDIEGGLEALLIPPKIQTQCGRGNDIKIETVHMDVPMSVDHYAKLSRF